MERALLLFLLLIAFCVMFLGKDLDENAQELLNQIEASRFNMKEADEWLLRRVKCLAFCLIFCLKFCSIKDSFVKRLLKKVYSNYFDYSIT